MNKNLLSKVKNLSPVQKQELLSLLEELEAAKSREKCHDGFMEFVSEMWSAFIHGHHHEIMADAFERVAKGDLKRLIINMPPRHTKSEFASYLLPAWFLGKYPDKKIIQTAHTAELAVGFGRKVRNLVNSADYKAIFPDVSLQSDSKAAGRWNTNQGGDYFAIGVGGAVTGKGADLLIIDDPHSEQEGALVKRDWWQVWEGRNPPDCEFVIQSWDTAFMKNQRADFSACTTWGVFYKEDDDGMLAPNLMLLDAYQERLEFPELKKMAMEKYNAYKPDAFIVEAKAAGMPLIFELRAMGIPVQEYTPSRGNDKISRVNAVSDLFASGVVWAPETRWAEETIEQFAGFPNMEHDDLVDSTTQALLRFRQGGFVSLYSDEEDEPLEHNRTANYY